MKRLLLILVLSMGLLPAWAAVLGDVTGDGKVDVEDVNAAINIILELKSADDYDGNKDLNGDGKMDIEDVNIIINIILGLYYEDESYTVNGVSFNMVAVEGGTFTMGATAEQGGEADVTESPVHQVTVSNFRIADTEVTQALWQAVMGSNPSYFTSKNNYTTNLQRPVENVSWDDCQTFISKLNKLTGRKFRLPTEAEWEYAARGGNKSKGYKYAGSNNIGDVAWYFESIPSQTIGKNGYGTQAVGKKAPNELGLYDMSGNVWEWCQDWYGSYRSSAQVNPSGPSSGSVRVNRGGSWFYYAWYCRVTNRHSYSPSTRYYNLGLRLAQ
ncbi:MAG: SUMF1/EgtB/PvdO family nonheme iron enzyme [Muribaculaceae bacterium]|nr:SUMF1/EgtB/PvdO family nonheme iron enzyme [Muribaculaceae bacterium]